VAPTRPPPPSSAARRMKPRLDTALGGSESAGERAIVSAGRARSYHPFAHDVHKKIRSPSSTGDGRSRPGAQSHLWLRSMLALALAAVVASAPSTLGDERLLVATARVSTNPKARRDKPVPNYGVIWDHKLTRSGQPSTLAGWTWLRRQGVRSR